MQFDNSVLRNEEKIVFALRSLYQKNGYVPYKMSKFEEYELYARNKEFLVSDKIITFTDTTGKLKALKPDVTLSIIKNTSDADGVIQKLYYNENVYRAADDINGFKELMQTGIECIGDLKKNDISDVVLLAAESLSLLSDNAVLEISHLGIVSGILYGQDISPEGREGLFRCISEKNPHMLVQICEEECICADVKEALLGLVSIYGTPDEVLSDLKDIILKFISSENCRDEAPLRTAMLEISSVVLAFEKTDCRNMLRLDFSVTGDMNYYNGIIFSGFISGVPSAVLSGGQYDRLMQSLKRKSRAIGFAVYMDALERIGTGEGSKCDDFSADEDKYEANAGGDISGRINVSDNCEKEYINIALPKGRLGEKVYEMFAKAGYECPSILENNRKLIFENEDAHVRYFWAKPSDVTTYVEKGSADIGVAGKDIILENSPDIYELLDLNTGKCRMCVAAPEDFKDDTSKTLRVATKFTNIAANYFSSQDREIDLIKLNGSIEIAPILGLSDVIVDIVETGTTLRENNLAVITSIVPISARLIANKASYKFKSKEIRKIQECLAVLVKEK